MAIAQAGNVSYVNNAANGTTVQAAGLPATAGHTQLVMVIANTAPASWSAPANFSLVDTGTGANRSWAIFKATSSLVANPTFTCTVSSLLSLIAVEFSGSTGVVDVHSTSFNANSATGNSTAVVPTLGGDALVVLGMNDAGGSAVTTPPAGYTEVSPTGGAAGTQFGERAWFLINPALSSQQPTITWNYFPTGNTAFTAYVALEAAITPVSASDTADTMSDAVSTARIITSTGDVADTTADAPAIGKTKGVSAADTGATISETKQFSRTLPDAETGATVVDSPAAGNVVPGTIPVNPGDIGAEVFDRPVVQQVQSGAPPPPSGYTVLRGKASFADVLIYDTASNFALPPATLSSNQSNTFVAAGLPLGLNVKILALSLFTPSNFGGNPISVNLCLDSAAENGMGTPDNSLLGVVPPAVAQPGNCLWAVDQTLTLAQNACATLYPINDGWDIIWPAGHLLTLRVVTGAGALGTTLYAIAWGKIVDINPSAPNTFNTFIPGPKFL